MIQQTTLPNGIRIITDTIPYVETVSLGAWFGVGARYENVTENGLSHVLEHMAFKGTSNRSASEISNAIESVGGYLNAYTSREATAYYARILKGDITLATHIIGDILCNSLFAQEELEKEKKVILQEIAMTHDTPDDIIFDYFQSACYPDQAFGRSILGPSSNVMGFTPHQVRTFMGKHYSTRNLIFAAAGNVDHNTLTDLVSAQFNNFQDHTPPQKETAIYQGGDARIEKDLEQTHLVLGFEGVTITHADYYTQILAATIMGGGMSSRLFQEIRETRGLVYGISAFAQCHADTGVFGIYAGTNPEDVPELIPAIAEEMHKASSGIAETELVRAKAQIKASLLMGMESTSHRCERIAHHMLNYGRMKEMDEIVNEIESVTASHIQNYLKNLINSNPTVAALGKIHNLPPYDTFKNYLNG